MGQDMMRVVQDMMLVGDSMKPVGDSMKPVGDDRWSSRPETHEIRITPYAAHR